jgi:hypothetical protein
MTYYLNNSEFNNKTKSLIDNENKKNSNFKGSPHNESPHNTNNNNNNQKQIVYYNNDNYDFDINYNNNTSSYYRQNNEQSCIEKNNFVNNLLNNNNNLTNEIIIISSSSDNDEKIDFDDDFENEILKSSSVAPVVVVVPTKVQENLKINDYLNILISSTSTPKLELLKCKYLNKFLSYYNKNKFNNFEDLKFFSMLLRKTLGKIKIKQDFNEIHAKNDEQKNQFLAFDNLTYSSSVEDLSSNIPNRTTRQSEHQQQQQEQKSGQTDALSKKTLKSIKRKDKLKKEIKVANNDNTSINVADTRQGSRSRQRKQTAEQTAENEDLVLSNKEFEKQLRRKYRCKSVARSIRRAKTVYYRNRRSKSMENLSALSLAELKLKYPEEKDEHLNKLAISRANSIMSSCSSFTSATSCASDLSSSYFHELSDWSPNFSDSESVDSNSISLEDVDWDANLPELPLVSCLF